LQDGYQLYHHNFIFTKNGQWSVIQQGMNDSTHYARRYHWLSEEVHDFVCEPHKAICCDRRNTPVLNLVAQESSAARETIPQISCQSPDKTIHEFNHLITLKLPAHHQVELSQINPKRLSQILLKTYDIQPNNFETLLGLPGIGPKAIRALSLISELVYGVTPSFRDPARFSFAHGGKDGHPYPVNRELYDQSIEILRKAVSSAKLGNDEKVQALKRLSVFERNSTASS